MDLQAIAETAKIVRDGGVTAMLVVAIIGGWKGLYVWRWQYTERQAIDAARLEDMTRDRDEWKSVALRGLKMAERAHGVDG